MAAAKPADVSTSTKVAAKPSSTATTAATGLPGAIPGQAPAGEGATGGPANPVSNNAGASPQSQCYQCFIPFTRYDYFARYRSYPVSTIAKIFFTNDGGNYVCSGSVIGDHTVWTAGHCTSNTDGTHQFDSSMLVCPSYNAGVNPAVGCWSASSFATSTAWLNTGSFENDLGAAVMNNCGTVHCQSIGSYTGHLGFAWNWSEDQNWYAFGYPQAAPFDGNYIVLSNSEFGYEDSDGNNQGAANSMAMGSDQTGGSSGGPWVWQFGTGNYVNGHNDWKWSNLPNAMNSPYFGSLACNVAVAAGAFSTTC
jgi:V8-like Glu-specific endopeptidase